jgi:hypothetical protein
MASAARRTTSCTTAVTNFEHPYFRDRNIFYLHTSKPLGCSLVTCVGAMEEGIDVDTAQYGFIHGIPFRLWVIINSSGS